MELRFRPSKGLRKVIAVTVVLQNLVLLIFILRSDQPVLKALRYNHASRLRHFLQRRIIATNDSQSSIEHTHRSILNKSRAHVGTAASRQDNRTDPFEDQPVVLAKIHDAGIVIVENVRFVNVDNRSSHSQVNTSASSDRGDGNRSRFVIISCVREPPSPNASSEEARPSPSDTCWLHARSNPFVHH
jgi:hypothetical protein